MHSLVLGIIRINILEILSKVTFDSNLDQIKQDIEKLDDFKSQITSLSESQENHLDIILPEVARGAFQIKELRNNLVDETIVGLLQLMGDISNSKTEEKPTLFRELVSSAYIADTDAFNVAKEKFKRKCSDVVTVLDFLESKTSIKNPQLATEIECKKRRLERIQPSLVNSLATVCTNIGDPASKELADLLIKNWEDDTKDLNGIIAGQKSVLEPVEVANATGIFIWIGIYHRNHAI
jgi:hypothetical protein